MGKTNNKGAKMDPQQVTDWFQKLMEGARKGLQEFTEVAQETTFEVRISNDGKGIFFEADLNIVPDYEREEELTPIEEAELRVDEDEIDLIKRAMQKSGGDIKKTAEYLGWSTRNLKHKLTLYNL